MAHPVPSQSIVGHHGHGAHNHHPPQNLNQTHHNHLPQHHNPLHPGLTRDTMHSSSTSQSTQQKTGQDNDEETIARKKKNADAQAAFRQRRQTYIKSLEGTVEELKVAVTEMEAVVEKTSHEAKTQRQRVEYLQNRLAGYESGELKFDQQHCKCCKYATQDFHSRLPTPGRNGQQQSKPMPTPSTSALTINPGTDCPAATGPSITTPATVTPQETNTRDWSSRQAIPPIFHSGTGSRSNLHLHSTQDSSNDLPHSSKSPDYPRNILHQSSSSLHDPSYSRPNCDLSLFNPFNAAENNSISHYYPSVAEATHGSAQSVGHSSSPNGVCSSLELGSHPTHLQPIMSHTYDRSPPIRQPHSLAAAYSPLGPQQPFDSHHSGTLSSPRTWSTSNLNNHITDSETHSRPHLDSSTKTSLYPNEGSVADSGSSAFRMHHSINERSIMRPTDFLPALEHRTMSQSYSMIPSLTSPGLDTASGPAGFKNRAGVSKRQREWDGDKTEPNHDTHEADSSMNPAKSGGSVGKLNGLPAKVARCNQTVLEISKVVSKAKKDAQVVTAASSSSISATRHSVSPNSTISSGFMDSPDLSHDHSKYQGVKLNGSAQPIASSTLH